MLKAITFDLWNTLLRDKNFNDTRLSILSEALETEGQFVFEKDLSRAYTAAQKRHDELWEKEYCHYQLENRIDDILKEVDRTLSPAMKKRVIEFFGDAFLKDPPSLTDGAAETIEALSGSFKLGIISDTGVTSGAQIRRLLDQKGLMGHFSATVFSDETGVCKPQREAFIDALNQLDVEAPEAMHVGDLLRTDVVGAKTVGMKAVWLEVREPDAMGERPDYTIKKLRELLAIPEIRERL